MVKRFLDKMSKTFDICLWIPFATLTFVIIEKMVSGLLTNFNLPKKCKMCSDVMGSIAVGPILQAENSTN